MSMNYQAMLQMIVMKYQVQAEARAIANDVLDSSDWIHSVDEGEFSYRVNYGRENEDRAHRGIHSRKKVMVVPQNGMAMSGTIKIVIVGE